MEEECSARLVAPSSLAVTANEELEFRDQNSYREVALLDKKHLGSSAHVQCETCSLVTVPLSLCLSVCLSVLHSPPVSALYVVDLKKFRKIAAGDRLRGQYQALSQDPNSLSNLDQVHSTGTTSF